MTDSHEIIENHAEAEIGAIETKKIIREPSVKKRLIKHHVTGVTHPIRFQHISAQADSQRRAYRILWGTHEIGIASSYMEYSNHWDATCTAMFDPYESDTVRGLRSKDYVVEWLLEHSGISCTSDSRRDLTRPCEHTLATKRSKLDTIENISRELSARLRATGLDGTVGERAHRITLKLIEDMTGESDGA